MISSYKKFISERFVNLDGPGPNEPGCVKLEIDSAEEFSENSTLSGLLKTGKVYLNGNEVWYFQEDKETESKLSQFFDEGIEDPIGYDEENESKINENVSSEIRVERRDGNGDGPVYAFVKIVNGNVSKGEDIVLDFREKQEIEKLLNSRLTSTHNYPID